MSEEICAKLLTVPLITEHQRYRALPFSRKTFNVFSPSCAQKTAQQDAVYA